MPSKIHCERRRGAAAVLICILLVPLLGLLAFSIDYGYLLKVRTDLQRTADQASLAAVRDLLPDEYGNQNLATVRETVRQYVQSNLGDSFIVNDSDIKIGRYNPATIYTSLEILETGLFDTVQVTLRRNPETNGAVNLFFAQFLDIEDAGVASSGTAILSKGQFLRPGADVFPFTLDEQAWDGLGVGDELSIYGSGKVKDTSGNDIPGNWGTVDIGPRSNSTADLSRQIREGLSQGDLNSLYDQGVIDSTSEIDVDQVLNINGDTGLSSGLKHALEEVQGQTKLMPIYRSTNGGTGNNLEYEIVSWGVVTIGESKFAGNKKSYINVRRSFGYDGSIGVSADLSNTSNSVEGLFGAPVLIQ